MKRHPRHDRRFDRRERLQLDRDFRTVFEHGNSAGGRLVVVYGRPNDLPYSRLGLTVSRRFGIAVVRHRFKRWCREAFRLTKDRQPIGFDWIVLPRRGRTGAGCMPAAMFEQFTYDLLAQMAKVAQREQQRSDKSNDGNVHRRDERSAPAD